MHGTFNICEQKLTGTEVELLTYPACPESPTEWNWLDAEEVNSGQETAVSAGISAGAADFEKRLEAERERSFEAGRAHGQAEGRQAERDAQAAAQKAAQTQSTRQAAEFVSRFAEERDRYMQAAEHEVVRLALAIAARILRREAQMDPLLLTGAVRVALGQLAGTTEARLLVPPAELDLWTEAMAHLPNLPLKPTVQAGEGMRLGECMLETTLGSIDLGIRSQLAEIERGFFDRAANTERNGSRQRNESRTGEKIS